MVHPMTRIMICFAILLATCHVRADNEKAADIALVGGKIITLGKDNAIAEAIAILDGRILAVGTNKRIQDFVSKRTQVIQLDGKTVIPGIIETHCHAIGVGRNAMIQPFVELSTIAELQDWIRQRAKEVPPGRWIRVPRADITRLKERRHPTPAELDAACSTHPILFNAARKNVLNSLGFKSVEIDDETDSVPGGELIRDKDGRIVMIAGGDGYLRKFMPRREFTEEETLAGLRRVHQIYNSVGITSIFERATNLDGVKLYQRLRDADQLTVRTTATIRQQFRDGKGVEKFTKEIGIKSGDGDDWVRVGPLKITVDGGIHWGNTYLREPYGDRRVAFYRLKDSNYRGDRRYTFEQMTDIFSAGHRLGWQMCCHVTGDAGVDSVLDALEHVQRLYNIRDQRFTLIHCYFPIEDSIARCRKLGVCVDTQSYLYYKDSDAMAEVYGRSWAERLIGVGDWLKGGVPVAINSDHMIGLDPDHAMNSFNPFLQMYIAASRKNENGRVYGAHQKVSRIDALRMMTSLAAHLSFDESKKGTLESGKLADFAVLDRDLLECPEDKIRQIKVMKTFVGGKKVFDRSE